MNLFVGAVLFALGCVLVVINLVTIDPLRPPPRPSRPHARRF